MRPTRGNQLTPEPVSRAGEAARLGETARPRTSAEPCREGVVAGEGTRRPPRPARNRACGLRRGSFRGRRAVAVGHAAGRLPRRRSFNGSTKNPTQHGTRRTRLSAASQKPFGRSLGGTGAEATGCRNAVPEKRPRPNARRNRLRHFPALRNFRETGRLRRSRLHFAPTARRWYGIVPAAGARGVGGSGKVVLFRNQAKREAVGMRIAFPKAFKGRLPVA